MADVTRLMILLVPSLLMCIPIPNTFAGTQSQGAKKTASLFSALQSTLTRNPRILAEKERIGAFQATLGSEKKQWWPGISFGGTARESDESRAYVSLEQPVWMGGRIGNTIEKAKVQVALAKKELLRIQRVLMEETVVAYTSVTGLNQRIRAAGKNIDEHERFLELITRREAGQISSEADVQLARSRYSQAVLTKEDLLGQRQLALNDLFSLTRTSMAVFEPVPAMALELPGHAEVEASVEDASPRIDQSVLEIESASIDRLISRSEYFPSVYGRLEQDIYDKEGTSSQHRDTTLSMMVQGTLDGAGFRTVDQVRAAEARIRTAKQALDAEKNDILRGTRGLLSERDTVRELVALNSSLVQSTAETLASYTRQFEAGRKSWLDLLNVQREHSNARLTLELVKSRYEQVCLRLAVQMGKLDGPGGIHP